MEEIGKDPDDFWCEKFGSGSGDGQQRYNQSKQGQWLRLCRGTEAVDWTIGHLMKF
jgi:hypothetical protein